MEVETETLEKPGKWVFSRAFVILGETVKYHTLLDISSPISGNYRFLSIDLGDFWGKILGKGFPQMVF